MLLTRRDCLALAGAGGFGWLAQSPFDEAQGVPSRGRGTDRERRIAAIVRDYEGQGFHRTATSVDNASGDWLMRQVRDAGLSPARETFTIDRVDPIAVYVIARTRQI